MLFFHRRLRSLVTVDLKISEFMPEYVRKMNFYFSLVDRHEPAQTWQQTCDWNFTVSLYGNISDFIVSLPDKVHKDYPFRMV